MSSTAYLTESNPTVQVSFTEEGNQVAAYLNEQSRAPLLKPLTLSTRPVSDTTTVTVTVGIVDYQVTTYGIVNGRLAYSSDGNADAPESGEFLKLYHDGTKWTISYFIDALESAVFNAAPGTQAHPWQAFWRQEDSISVAHVSTGGTAGLLNQTAIVNELETWQMVGTDPILWVRTDGNGGGSVDAETIGWMIHEAEINENPADVDQFGIFDSVRWTLGSITWGVIKSKLKTYFDALYSAVGHSHAWSAITDKPTTFAPVIGSGANDAAAGNHNHSGTYDPAGAAATAESNAKSYADGLVIGLIDDRGNYDASGNTFPTTGGSGPAGAILKGDLWTVSVAGTLGGHAVTSGDLVRALTDAPGQTDANSAITENNIGYVPENSSNKSSSVATDATSTTKYPTVKAIYDWATGLFAMASRTINGHALSGDITVSKSDVGLGSVENTALSTWAGTINITTIGTLSALSLANGATVTLTGTAQTNFLTAIGASKTLSDGKPILWDSTQKLTRANLGFGSVGDDLAVAATIGAVQKALGWLAMKMTGNESRTQSDGQTLADVAAMNTVTLAADTTYEVIGFFPLAIGGCGLKMSLVLPDMWQNDGSVSNALMIQAAGANPAPVSYGSGAISLGSTSATNSGVTWHAFGIIRTGSSEGTAKLQIASNAASAGTTTLQSAAIIVFKPIKL